ncbi:MAG: (d)CMP kinase [Clostridia bacterium]|nr:(d)CMP kinase [Clostridia bacterium]
MIKIAVDGPSGSGKSTLAKNLSRALGIVYVDTGALYRTIGLYMLREGVNPTDAAAVAARLGSASVGFDHADGAQKVYLNGEDVTSLIRTPEVSMAASAVSSIPAVRAHLLSLQRDIAKEHDVVMDGRDIGTVIFPDADVKIFMCSDEATRSERRFAELSEKGIEITKERVAAELSERDKNDSGRSIAPLVPAEDAVWLDNSTLEPEQTLSVALGIIRGRLAAKERS